MTDPRKNDDLIIYKLDQLQIRLDGHVEEMQHAIHGNGNPGLKTAVEVLKTRVVVLWGFMTTVLGLVINDYMNRG